MTHASFHGASQSDYRLLHPEKKRGKMILTIRTDKPEAELGIFENNKQLEYFKWQADRQLADTLNKQIEEIFTRQNLKNFRRASKLSIKLSDIDGIVCFEGPGSFTGLRIGMSVANALAYAVSVPIVARGGDDWIATGIQDILSGKDQKIVTPKYGAEPNVTKPKH